MKRYDAIVVGSRCAGSPTAMLLARRGLDVLLVDRAEFPSDTVSTHVVQAPAVAALSRWGLLDQVVASGCPEIREYRFDFGPVTIAGTPFPVDGVSATYAPRRTVLDKILVDAAVASGVEFRPRFTVEEYVVEGSAVVGIRGHERGGTSVTEHATVIVGADGRNSLLARVVGAETYAVTPKLQGGYYTYYSDLPADAFEIHTVPNRGFAAAPTNDGLTMVVCGWPIAERDEFRADPEAHLLATFDLAPEFAERVRAARREERLTWGSVSGYFRKRHGDGWALVGDARYNKDPITAQGITDAFRDAELCAQAIADAADGIRPLDEGLAAYHAARDAAVMPVYGFTNEVATLAPPPEELQQLLASIAGNQRAMDAFVSVNAATLSPERFFDPAYLSELVGAPS